MKLTYFKKNVSGVIFIFLMTSSFSQNIDKKSYQTAFTKTPPGIDGLMNDEGWNLVEWGENFTQIQPYENKPPTQETAFKILYDDNNLYVFIRAFDKEPEKISRLMSRRDNFDGDMVSENLN